MKAVLKAKMKNIRREIIDGMDFSALNSHDSLKDIIYREIIKMKETVNIEILIQALIEKNLGLNLIEIRDTVKKAIFEKEQLIKSEREYNFSDDLILEWLSLNQEKTIDLNQYEKDEGAPTKEQLMSFAEKYKSIFIIQLNANNHIGKIKIKNQEN